MHPEGIFGVWLETKPIFKNREYLRPTYTPEDLPHREEQIRQLAQILVAPLRGETPSNVFIYGKTGTGKTATVNYIMKELERVGDRAPKKVFWSYVNCEQVNTRYRVLATLANTFIGKIRARPRERPDLKDEVPMTGWPTDGVYGYFTRTLDAEPQFAVVVLDEVDKLVQRSGDDVLYDLTRMNSGLERSRVSVVGISNDVRFMSYLDPRVRSSLGEEELVFQPYNAHQLRDILGRRAEMGFVEGAIGDGVISLCAAHAAREHGDARRALDLLRVAGELAEREGAELVTVEHVQRAFEKIERDHMDEVIRSLPTQSKLVLYSVIMLAERGVRRITTGEVYNLYRSLCRRNGLDILTPRRVSDFISELDMLGVISAQVVSSGRYGRTKQICLNLPEVQARAALQEDHSIGTPEILDFPRQLTLT